MTSPANLTREQAIAQVVSELESATPLEVVVDRVLQRKPSRAKDPRAPIRGDIRMHTDRFGVVFTDPERKIVVPANVAMRGVRFRHPITDVEINNRMLFWDEGDYIYFPSHYLPPDPRRNDLLLVDADGHLFAEELRSVPLRTASSVGPIVVDTWGRKIDAILRQHQARAGDSFLFTIEQFDPPRLRMEYEPQAQRDEAVIEQRNRELMDLLYQMLEASSQEQISGSTILATGMSTSCNWKQRWTRSRRPSWTTIRVWWRPTSRGCSTVHPARRKASKLWVSGVAGIVQTNRMKMSCCAKNARAWSNTKIIIWRSGCISAAASAVAYTSGSRALGDSPATPART
jgi:hypothetical protein